MKHESMYLHPELETMTRPEIEKLQMERLLATDSATLYAHSFL